MWISAAPGENQEGSGVWPLPPDSRIRRCYWPAAITATKMPFVNVNENGAVLETA